MELIERQRTRLFASFYRITKSSIGLILASLGAPPFLSRTSPPKIADLITPIQVWTEDSYASYIIARDFKEAFLEAKVSDKGNMDFATFKSDLCQMGHILHLSNTRPGFGFHYHNGEVSVDGVKYIPIKDFLFDRFGKKVVCADASILRNIGLRPHTLTAMAAGYKQIINLMD